MSAYKRTSELQRGDRVVVFGRLVRTVERVTPAGYVGMTGRPVFHVYYQEGRTPEWSNANSAIATTEWELAA